MNPIRRGIRVGALIAVVSSALWALAIAATPPEPAEFLQLIRAQSPATTTNSGVSFDVRTSSHCPAFVILGRGFGSGVDPLPVIPLTIWSLPALALARLGATRGWGIELNLAHFIGALLLQSMLVGIAVEFTRRTPQGNASSS